MAYTYCLLLDSEMHKIEPPPYTSPMESLVASSKVLSEALIAR